jgi:hypothetical protein
MTKNLFLSVTLLVCLILPGALVAPAQASSPVRPAGGQAFDYAMPQDVAKNKDVEARWTPLSLYSLFRTATCSLVTAGKGIVMSMQLAGEVTLYDSDSAASVSSTFDSTKTVIFHANADTTKVPGSYALVPARPFSYGLVICGGSASAEAQGVYARQQ